MRLKKSICILIWFFCSIAFTGYSCDTSLIRMFAAQSPEEGYFKFLERMAVNTEKIGSSAQWNIFAREPLQDLMESWLAFETEYRNTPPHWIESTVDWPSKFIAVARQIGIMRAASRNEDFTALHDAALELSQKLNIFLLEVEVSESQQILVQLPLNMQHLRSLRREKNREALHELSLSLFQSVRRLQSLAPDEHKKIFDALIAKTEALHVALDKNRPNSEVFTWDLYNIMKDVDDTYRSTTDMLFEQKLRDEQEEVKNEQ